MWSSIWTWAGIAGESSLGKVFSCTLRSNICESAIEGGRGDELRRGRPVGYGFDGRCGEAGTGFRSGCGDFDGDAGRIALTAVAVDGRNVLFGGIALQLVFFSVSSSFFLPNRPKNFLFPDLFGSLVSLWLAEGEWFSALKLVASVSCSPSKGTAEFLGLVDECAVVLASPTLLIMRVAVDSERLPRI